MEKTKNEIYTIQEFVQQNESFLDELLKERDHLTEERSELLWLLQNLSEDLQAVRKRLSFIFHH